MRGDRAEFEDGDLWSSEFVALTVAPPVQGFRQTAPKAGKIKRGPRPKHKSWPIGPGLGNDLNLSRRDGLLKT